MDELEISGKRYLSTKRAGREHGYHSDYMGQLIRGGKVVGQKVGRAWYIEEDSLNAYLNKAPLNAPGVGRTSSDEVLPAPAIVEVQKEEVAEVSEVAPVEVAPVLQPVAKQPAAQYIAHPESVLQQPIEEETRIPVRIPTPAPAPTPLYRGGLRYEHDDSPSLPTITRMPQPQQYAQPQEQMYTAQARTLPQMSRERGRFPAASLSIVALFALCAAAFASNFITATVATGQGEAASVTYAIHW